MRQAGWQVGDQLALSVDAVANGALTIGPASGGANARSVRVWDASRVRISKTKLAGAASPVQVDTLRFSVSGSMLRIEG